MNKSLLTASVLGVFNAAVSTVAFADNMVNASTFCKPGFYAGVQGGRSDTFYGTDDVLGEVARNHTGTDYTIFTDPNTGTTTFINSTSSSSLSRAHIDDTGIGGRLYAGYQFTPYFALEGGFTQFAKTEFSATENVQTTYPSNRSTEVTPYKYNGEVTERAIDLIAKGTLPLQYGFGVYLGAGMAYISADRHINGTVGPSTSYRTRHITTDYTKSYQAFRPIADVGINYTIPNTSISVVADYKRIFASGGIKDASLASLGVEYKFA